MERSVRRQLGLMMALVYGVQGAWYPLLSVHLGDLGYSGRARGLIFATLAIGSVAAPLAVGRLADRRFAIERLLSVFYVIGAMILAAIAASGRVRPAVLYALFQAYWLVIAPAISLSTTLALRNLARPADQFGGVRASGTVGWMVTGWIVALVMSLAGTTGKGGGVEEGFWLAAGLSLVLAAFAAVGLPHTPPLARAESDLSGRRRWADALEIVRTPGVAPYLVVAFGVAVTIPYMYQVIPNYLVARGLERRWIAPVMSLGQVLEVMGLAVLPWLLRRFGFGRTLGLGIFCWVARYAHLAGEPSLEGAVAGTLLHGLAVACFTIGGQMYFDRLSPPHRRAEAQGLHVVVSSGVGVLVGSLLAGEATAGDPADGGIFRLPLLIDVVCLSLWVPIAWRGRSRVVSLVEPATSA